MRISSPIKARFTGYTFSQEWIGRFLVSDRSSGAVSWQDVSPVGEWPEFFADAGEQLFVVPVRKIGPADPAAEEDIAADDEILSREVETETVRRMSRDVEQGKRQVTELQCIFPGEEMLDRVGGNGAGIPIICSSRLERVRSSDGSA